MDRSFQGSHSSRMDCECMRILRTGKASVCAVRFCINVWSKEQPNVASSFYGGRQSLASMAKPRGCGAERFAPDGSLGLTDTDHACATGRACNQPLTTNHATQAAGIIALSRGRTTWKFTGDDTRRRM